MLDISLDYPKIISQKWNLCCKLQLPILTLVFNTFNTGWVVSGPYRIWTTYCVGVCRTVYSPGNPLMRGAGAHLMRVRFTLHHDLQVKEPFLQKNYNDV